VVVADVAVRQDVVAEQLAAAQPGAVAEHQPAMRPQHRDVVGDRLGVAGPDADIDEGDAVAAGALEMIGRHLRQPGGPRRLGLVARADDDIAGLDEGDGAAVAGHLGPADGDELVDVALVVGQQHEFLEMLGRGAGVVVEPCHRVVDPLGGEEGERPRRVGPGLVGAVGDGVVGGAEVGQREEALQRPQIRLGDVGDALLDDEGQRDLAVARPTTTATP